MVSDELCDDCTSDCDSIFQRTYPECKFIAANYDVKLILKSLESTLRRQKCRIGANIGV